MAEDRQRHIEWRTDNQALVLTILEREVRDSDVCLELRDELISALDRSQCRNVVLDFGQVSFMASSGFLPLLHLNRQVQKGGGRVILCNLSEQLREMFRVTRLLITPPAEVGLFEEQPDVNSAIAKLR